MNAVFLSLLAKKQEYSTATLMKKLHELIEIISNNDDCVVAKVKDDVQPVELICLGGFTGQESMFRLSKVQSEKECTIFYEDGSNYYWSAGQMCSNDISTAAQSVIKCITQRFNIYVGNNKEYIHATSNIMSIADSKGKYETYELVWKEQHPEDGIVIRKHGEFYDRYPTLDETYAAIEEIIDITKKTNITGGNYGTSIQRVSGTRK